MVFHIGPNHRTPWRFDLPGAIVTALGWAVSTQLFALYVRFAGGRNEVQSTVGAVLLFLSLMYVLGTVIIVGAELNDVISSRAGVVHERPSVRAKARTLRDRLRNGD
jgi:membrane protein